MKEKKEIVLKLIDDIKKQFENNGYIISSETYEKVTNEILNSEKYIEELKIELYALVNKKIQELKIQKEKERLKEVDIEDYQNEILTIESLDRYGYPNVINSSLEIIGSSEVGHNAPINVKYGNKNGFYKNSANTSTSSLDKFEFIICQIGKMFNIKMAETYKVYSNNAYLGIISENVCNHHETLYMYSRISKFINKEELKELIETLEKLGKKKATIKSKGNDYKIPVVESPEDIKFVINSFLEVVKSLKISEEEQRSIRQDYFNMIMLDFIINNVDRNKNNYGLIISEYGEVSFSPLFDNSTIDIPSMPKGYQQINGFLINKNKLLDCLYTNYYEDIRYTTQTCLRNRETLSNKVYDLCSNELGISDQEWFFGTFNNNLNMIVDKELNNEDNRDESSTTLTDKSKVEEGPKLVRTKPTTSNDITTNNAGKINLILILLSISLVLILTTLIILFKLK